MRKTRIRKKRKAVSLRQIALDVAEDAWKKAIARRAKGICEVHKESCTGEVMQADHFRSRRHMTTFLMHENGTLVCSGLNQNKSMGINHAAEKIAFVVLKREGQVMVDFLMSFHPPKKFTVMELENITHELNGLFQEKGNRTT